MSIGKIFRYLIIVLYFFAYKASAQYPKEESFLNRISSIGKDTTLTEAAKLQRFYSLKDLFIKSKLQPDSVYSAILLKIEYYEVHNNKNFNLAIDLANESVRINTNNKLKGSKFLATKAYYNLAAYYYQLSLYNKALSYFDSTIIIANTFPDTTNYITRSRLYKAYIYFQHGDYQKAVEESTLGIYTSTKKKDSTRFLDLLTQRAQSLYYENRLNEAVADVNLMINVAKKNNALYELASALKIKAIIFQKKQQFKIADSLFKIAIATMLQTEDFDQVARDYIDYGNFYIDYNNQYKKAKYCYLQTIEYAKKIDDPLLLSKANTNLAELYLMQEDLYSSSKYCIKALACLNTPVSDIYKNPLSIDLYEVGAKETIIVLINNKIKILLGLFINKGDHNALVACLETCLLMDTIITKMRCEQTGNQSKLYWRDYTKEFYANAIEASFLATRPDIGFYFTEKSRAVLLNDKLNELNAASYLSSADISRQENYEIKIIELQQKLASTDQNSKQFQAIELQLINTKDKSEKFIKSLEQKYPDYYQYKYDDKVPALRDLQLFLAKNHQSFVHYFTGDTATYILGIVPTQTKFVRLSQKEFDKKKLSQFLKLCANKQALNNTYNSFAELSNTIYLSLFKQLQIPKGRVVICMDNTIIPFEALCTDTKGKQFLLNDYSFDYAYSARFLMKEFKNPPAKGNFAGFAPVSFAKHLAVVDLKNAATALNTSASYYGNDKLFTHQNASRNNFFNHAPSYSVVSVFSHAYADTTDNEPVLFMCDSLIYLPELQKLNNPATKLVLLSACQTNVGKNAAGEGIYSLARGFATAGIPSVAATLWKADEQMIYAISEKLNEYLAEGMNKDEALQKAKLYFVRNSNPEKMLPYYWANMILIGNGDAIQFKVHPHYNYLWWIGAGMIVIASAIRFARRRKL